MAQEDFEGYTSQHLGEVIDAVVQWGKRFTDIDLAKDHAALMTAVSDLTKLSEALKTNIDNLIGPNGILREFALNTYLYTENEEGQLWVCNANKDELGEVFAKDFTAKENGKPIHRLSEKANLSDVTTLTEKVSGFSGLKDISRNDMDMGLTETSLSSGAYTKKLKEIGGMYRVFNGLPTSAQTVPIGILQVFGDDMRHAIYETFTTNLFPPHSENNNGDNWGGHPNAPDSPTWTRQYSFVEHHGTPGTWSEWKNTQQAYIDRLETLEKNATVIASNAETNRVTLESLKVYDEVVRDGEWSGSLPKPLDKTEADKSELESGTGGTQVP